MTGHAADPPPLTTTTVTTYANALALSGTIAGTDCTISGLDWGSDPSRVVLLGFSRRVDRKPAFTAAAIGAVSGTILGTGDEVFANDANRGARLAMVLNPPSGVADLSLTFTNADAGNSDLIGWAWIGTLSDLGQSAPSVVPANGNNTSNNTQSTVSVSSAAGRRVVGFHFLQSNDSSFSGTADSPFVLRGGSSASGGQAHAVGDAPGDTSVAASVTWDDSNGTPSTDYIVLGVSLLPAASGGAAPRAMHHYRMQRAS